jgi:hypothetical protein
MSAQQAVVQDFDRWPAWTGVVRAPFHGNRQHRTGKLSLYGNSSHKVDRQSTLPSSSYKDRMLL